MTAQRIWLSLMMEVEDFARRLNSDWPQRIQEILALGQERRRIDVSADYKSCCILPSVKELCTTKQVGHDRPSSSKPHM
ncbi:hypothetical protein GBA52_022791 [Prunus armeniaca]|nr:hypothetical protein GBA52_022791 [Prunus armeniaca]